MKRILLTSVLLIFALVVFSQKEKAIQNLFEKAQEAYRQGKTALAIENSTKILSSDSSNINARLLLADIYKNLDSTLLEIKHLEFVFRDSTNTNSLVGFRLGEAYFIIGNYQKSLNVFEKTLKANNIPEERKLKIGSRINQCRFAINAVNNPVSDGAVNVGEGINTKADEYWPTLSINGKTLIFNRLILPEDKNGFKQEDFYKSVYSGNQWEKAEPVTEINTPENEGALTLSPDGKLMFFSACNRNDGYGSCDIYFSRFDGNRWAKPENVGRPLNSNAWESQPSLAANSRYLYYASNRAGGKGAMDIWRCRLLGFHEQGKPIWGLPENLGDSINTQGNELSPFMHFNGEDLYFSSDFWMGMGKKDVFRSTLKPDLTWSQPENVGYPINTYNDEQGFIIDASGTTAYCASNQNGNMDIFSFELFPENRPVAATYIKGKVLDTNSKQPLKAEIELRNIKLYHTDTIFSDDKGEFVVSLPLGSNYAFDVSKENYLFFSESFELDTVYEATNPYLMDILLQPVVKGAALVLRNIYFNTNSFELLPESEPELNKLVELLRKNAGITAEIGGHTDNIGTSDFNLVLSENRAKTVLNYLRKSGIEKQRLTFKGYGFSQPTTSNETEEGRHQNRRTEIKITGTGNPSQK